MKTVNSKYKSIAHCITFSPFPKRVIIIICCLFFTKQIFSQGFLRVDGKRIVNDKGEVLLRGIGLGGWMLQEPYMLQFNEIAGTQHEIRAKIEELIGKERTVAFYNAWLTNHCRKADIDSLAAWGFNSVRLPMHYNLFTLPIEQEPVAGKNTWLPKGFTMVDSLLTWCKANRIYLILDLHAAPGGEGHDNAISDRDSSKPSLWESEANQQKTIALLKELAKRYANEQWIGGYDLLNETNWGFQDAKDKNGCAEKGNEPLKKLLTDITAAIREVDKNHFIVIEGNCWGNNYSNVFPLWDKNMVVSFHKYWNYNDQKSIQNFIKIRDEQNVPVWCGESGENSNVWFSDAISLFEKNKIGWAWWPLKKLGNNNPLQIKPNKGYQQLLNSWKDKSAKPAADEAYNALMQLTEDIKAENAILHKDVIDAMFRQVHTNETLPFKEHNIKTGAIIFATDYDLGRNGFAYFDNDTANYRVSTGKNSAGNKGNVYRNDGVDIVACSDTTSNGYNVSSTEPGEWLQYTLAVPTKGAYNLEIRTASKDSMGKIAITVNNADEKVVSLPTTGAEQTWATTSIKNILLPKGTNTFRVRILNGGINLNYFRFVNTSEKIISSKQKLLN